MQQCIKILLFLILNEAQTGFGRHTAHHQEPKTAQAASGFAYVRGCWTLSGSVRYQTTSNVRQPSMYAKPEAACAVLGS